MKVWSQIPIVSINPNAHVKLWKNCYNMTILSQYALILSIDKNSLFFDTMQVLVLTLYMAYAHFYASSGESQQQS
jgi:hypothetical protein